MEISQKSELTIICLPQQNQTVLTYLRIRHAMGLVHISRIHREELDASGDIAVIQQLRTLPLLV